MWRPVALAVLLVGVVLCACAGGRKQGAAPTFTPVPAATGAAAAAGRTAVGRPVVDVNCLRGLSSYRFTGSFSARANAAPSSPALSGEAGGLVGSLANLLGNVSLEGSALAPDRYQAKISFGGGGVQPLEVVRIADQTFSRFGNSPWTLGDQIRGLGGLTQFDPQTLCQTVLASQDAGGQTAGHETVNGIPCLRYELSGAQLARTLRGAGAASPTARTPTVTAIDGTARLTVWTAEKGSYPIRWHFTTDSSSTSIDLEINVTDVNGKDIQIAPPS